MTVGEVLQSDEASGADDVLSRLATDDEKACDAGVRAADGRVAERPVCLLWNTV